MTRRGSDDAKSSSAAVAEIPQPPKKTTAVPIAGSERSALYSNVRSSEGLSRLAIRPALRLSLSRSLSPLMLTIMK